MEQFFDENIKNKNSISPKSNSFEVKLYNEKGEVLIAAKSEEGKRISFSTQNIANGTYYIHILEGKKIIKKQVIIRH